MTTFSLESVYGWYRGLVANPKYRWWVIAGTMLYLFSPFDIAPDFIPFIGQIDDAIVVTLLATELAQVLKERSAKFKQKRSPQEVAETVGSVDVQAVEID
ncbi:YkvA family protein [Altericista sp. CCNU0014]|uniref:YkvA family protein n=1 Tax=Altericista sp. CCNU0014 TaxID=3082949 RepID=UPI00384FB3E4